MKVLELFECHVECVLGIAKALKPMTSMYIYMHMIDRQDKIDNEPGDPYSKTTSDIDTFVMTAVEVSKHV